MRHPKESLKKVLSVVSLGAMFSIIGASAAMAAPALSITNGGTVATSIAAGDELNVTTGSTLASVGATSQQLGLSWSGQSLRLKDGSIVQPEGWNLEYSTDGQTWSATAPADLTTVVAVRSKGDLTSRGNDIFETKATSDLVVTQANFQGSSGGDGFDLTFAGDRVFNVFHHAASSVQIDCHLKASGTSCYNSVLNFPGYATSNTSTSFWAANSSKLYVMSKRVSDNQFGLTCVDFSAITTPVACSTPFYNLDDGVALTNSLEGATRVGEKVYLLDSSDYSLMCFNLATATACAGSPTTLPSTQTASTFGRLSSEGTKIWYNTYDRFGCWDTATNDSCAGVAPQTINPAKQYPPIPARNSAGNLLGMCLTLSQTCVDASNAVFTIPAGLGTFLDNNAIPTWNYDGAGIWAESGSKLYLNYGPSASATANVYCHDFTTDAACAGFAGTNVGTRIYAILKDPSVPNCMWTNGDAGQITTFNGTTGIAGCSLPYPIVEMPYTATVPRMACQETGRVLRWDKITFTVPAGIAAADLRITILDSNGAPITGWTDKTIGSNGVLDMTGLTVAQSGTKPTIQANAGVVDSALLDQLVADVKFKASAPELCVTLTAAATCPNFTPAQGDTSVPDGMLQATSVTTPKTGTAFGSETVSTLTGTNSSTLCASSLAKLEFPTTGGEDPMAATGPEEISPIAWGFGALAALALSGLLAFRLRRTENE